MDAEHFDTWVRGLDRRISRRGLSGGIAAALAALGLAGDADAKKKKKKKKKKPHQPDPEQTCAETCSTGCCTAKFGECILPAQQGCDQCGAGGELCHQCPTGECKPLGAACSPCEECCTEFPFVVECQEQHCCRPLTQLCTTTGECCPQLVCVPESDFDPELRCLGTIGAPCGFPSQCAGTLICPTGRCCVSTAFFCEVAEDCCAVEELCQVVPGAGDEKRCCKPTGESCTFHTACCSGSCNSTGNFRCD